VAATFRSSGDPAKFVQLEAVGQGHRFAGWMEWTDTRFGVRSSEPIELGIDGEGVVLEPPIEFRTLRRALRVRIPPAAPGYSPAAAVPRPGWSTITALVKTAIGRPISVGL